VAVCENGLVFPRRPTIRWWLQRFPLRMALPSLLVALTLTFASSLVPRPVYQQTGLEVIRYGYPMPFLVQDRSATRPETFPAFIAWTDGQVPVSLQWGLALVNVGFYLTAFALARVLFRRSR
jgi:hypothetical protein